VNSSASVLPYEQTGAFSGLVIDYLNAAPALQSMYHAEPNMNGLREAIAQRRSHTVNRPLLHEVLEDLYKKQASQKQKENIQSLLADTTFTICTAHQPNIFSGYLYFVYKILQVIRIAETMKTQMPDLHFVPVYYIGSEDNDLEELGQVKVDGVKMVWQTKQEGAVGRMKVDKALLQLITQLEGQLGVHPHGAAMVSMLRESYQEGTTIAAATKSLVDHLFSQYGLLVLDADDARLKSVMKPVFANDLVQHDAYRLVTYVGEEMQRQYKVQVNPREINLFYLIDGLRERIIENNGIYTTESGAIKMTREEILQLLDDHPECFSPNVVLRALYQESILPDIAFVGGGSEIAYWLELKPMFDHFKVPLPALVLRNSFIVAKAEDEQKLKTFGLGITDLFAGEFALIDKYVKAHSSKVLDTENERAAATEMFKGLKVKAAAVDQTLVQHIEALETKLDKKLADAGKKILRAEKRKFETEKSQLLKLRNKIFPNGTLQERVDNLMPYYAMYGPEFIDMLYKHSLSLEQQFTIIAIS
jgi:bacillithiol biosynthesis cysteine-adding enzyme BshC